MILALVFLLSQDDPAPRHIETLLKREELREAGMGGCGLPADKLEAQNALLQLQRDEVMPHLELGVDRVTQLGPETAYLAR